MERGKGGKKEEKSMRRGGSEGKRMRMRGKEGMREKGQRDRKGGDYFVGRAPSLPNIDLATLRLHI